MDTIKAALEILSRFRKAVEAQNVEGRKANPFRLLCDAELNRERSDIDVVVISKDFAGKDYWGADGHCRRRFMKFLSR